MLFVAIGQLRSTVDSAEAIREGLRPVTPCGVTLIAEYWTQNASARVMLVFEAGTYSAVDDVVRDWEEVVQFTISPAIDAHALPHDAGQSRLDRSGPFVGSRYLGQPASVQSLSVSRDRTEAIQDRERQDVEAVGMLTRREREILDLLSIGRSNREIAAELFISARTVERHVANMYQKLGMRSRAEAIAWSYKRQLLDRTA